MSVELEVDHWESRVVFFLERGTVKDQLEGLVSQMVERGILFDEAVGEFEKRFIKRVLDRVNGNQSRAAHVLGIHRNTLSRKLTEYKLDHRRHLSR
jgi:Fis family transcriptional regulator, factor for inversion stimulation protein